MKENNAATPSQGKDVLNKVQHTDTANTNVMNSNVDLNDSFNTVLNEDEEEDEPPVVEKKKAKSSKKSDDSMNQQGSTLEQKENTIDRIIVLRAIYGKTQGPCRLRPPLEKNTQRIYTGQEVMTEDEKRKQKVVVNYDTTITLVDGSQFDLKDEIQAIHWNWIKMHPYVSQSLEDAQSNIHALFYVEDLDADMDKKSTKRQLITMAMNMLSESTEAKKRDIIRLLGTNGKYFTVRQLNDFLEDRAFTDPAEVIRAFKDKNYHTRLLLYRLNDSRKITSDRGVWKYGDIVLGVTEEQALEYLKNPGNMALVNSMRKLVE